MRTLPALLAALALAPAAVRAQTITAAPGSAGKITLKLSITSEVPRGFWRDEKGSFIIDPATGKKIPAMFNFWSRYFPGDQLVLDYSEERQALAKRRYGTKEFLTDLITAGVIPGPVTGWSIRRVEADLYDSSGTYTDYRIKLYAVKNSHAPVLIPPAMLDVFSSAWLKGSTKTTVDYYDAPNPDDPSGWDYLGFTETGKRSYKSRSHIFAELAGPALIAPPIWAPYWWDDYDEVEYRKEFALSGVQSTGEGKYREILIGSFYYYAYVQPSFKITGIDGVGPVISGWWWDADAGEWLEDPLSETIVEGSLSGSVGKPGDFLSYPGLLD